MRKLTGLLVLLMAALFFVPEASGFFRPGFRVGAGFHGWAGVHHGLHHGYHYHNGFFRPGLGFPGRGFVNANVGLGNFGHVHNQGFGRFGVGAGAGYCPPAPVGLPQVQETVQNYSVRQQVAVDPPQTFSYGAPAAFGAVDPCPAPVQGFGAGEVAPACVGAGFRGPFRGGFRHY